MRVDLFCSSLLYLFFLLQTTTFLSAQNTERYEGEYTLLGGVSGRASFDYYEKNGDTVKHGVFRFSTSEYEGAGSGRYHSLNFMGSYKEGRMHRAWNYLNQDLLPRQKGRVEGKDLVVPTDGKEFMVSGSFDKGRADGEWTALDQRVKDSRVVDTLFQVQSRFEEGRVAGPLKASSPEMSLEGEFDEEGFLEGKWTLTDASKEFKDIRHYENGVLKRHFLVQGEDTTGLKGTLGGEGEARDAVPLNGKYLKALFYSNSIDGNGKDTSSRKTQKIEASNNFYRRSLFAFSSYEGQHIWRQVEGNDGVPLPRVRVRIFPYGVKEKAELDSIGNLLKRNRELFQEHFHDPQVDLGRHSYQDVSFYYEVMKRYREGNDALKKVHSLLSDSAFLYIDREVVKLRLIPHIAYPDSVNFKFDGEWERKAFDFPSGIASNEEDLEVLREQLDTIRRDMERIGAELDRILKKYKKEDLLAEKEGELVKRRDSLRGLFQGELEGDSLNPYHEKLAPRTLSFYEGRFERYAELGLERKIDQVEALISCYGEGLGLFHRLKDLPKKVQEIDDLYTESTWNPIHFTNMDHRVKKDLYKAFEEELIPYLIEDLRSSMECGKVEEKEENFDVLFQRMKELRSQKTKVLEKKIRRATGTDEVIEVMDLKFQTG